MAGAVAEVSTPTRPVKVSRNGNARTLSIPAEIAAAAHIDVGDEFQVEAIGDTLVYRRLSGQRSPGIVTGSGADRVMDLPPRAGMAVGPDPSPVPPIDWDF